MSLRGAQRRSNLTHGKWEAGDGKWDSQFSTVIFRKTRHFSAGIYTNYIYFNIMYHWQILGFIFFFIYSLFWFVNLHNPVPLYLLSGLYTAGVFGFILPMVYIGKILEDIYRRILVIVAMLYYIFGCAIVIKCVPILMYPKHLDEAVKMLMLILFSYVVLLLTSIILALLFPEMVVSKRNKGYVMKRPFLLALKLILAVLILFSIIILIFQWKEKGQVAVSSMSLLMLLSSYFLYILLINRHMELVSGKYSDPVPIDRKKEIEGPCIYTILSVKQGEKKYYYIYVGASKASCIKLLEHKKWPCWEKYSTGSLLVSSLPLTSKFFYPLESISIKRHLIKKYKPPCNMK
ncbi:MAG: hypothetical protein K8T10_18515 [Candidatus Eremiobacteraeota bacterium]|nr:hypothetical protein [Candidatus Eremiobacteraeota bacterium]